MTDRVMENVLKRLKWQEKNFGIELEL
jgi:hypothetical protein